MHHGLQGCYESRTSSSEINLARCCCCSLHHGCAHLREMAFPSQVQSVKSRASFGRFDTAFSDTHDPRLGHRRGSLRKCLTAKSVDPPSCCSPACTLMHVGTEKFRRERVPDLGKIDIC